MDVMLRRLDDGSINAKPGDEVEYFEDGEWKPAEYTGNVVDYDDHRKFYWQVQFEEDDKWVGIFRTHVRHARGGAGHLRLQVALMREFIADLSDGDWIEVGKREILANLDAYDFTVPSTDSDHQS